MVHEWCIFPSKPREAEVSDDELVSSKGIGLESGEWVFSYRKYCSDRSHVRTILGSSDNNNLLDERDDEIDFERVRCDDHRKEKKRKEIKVGETGTLNPCRTT